MFIDLHTHCIPDMDDGAADIQTALSMLSESYNQGVKLTVLTPHCILRDEGCIEDFLEKRNQKHDFIVSESISQKATIPELLLGAEVYLDNDISKFQGLDRLCMQGTNIMLLELPEGKISRRAAEWIYNLTLLGIHPLLAHIERYRMTQENFVEFSEFDTDYQVNANLFCSFKGRRVLKKMLNITDKLVVSSDMHNTGNRSCNLLRAYDIATSKFPQNAQALFVDNAVRLLKNQAK